MEKETVWVVARVTARPDQIDALKAILLELIAPTRLEAGCISYQLLQNSADPAEFTFIERWVSRSAIDAHLASTRIRDALSNAQSLLAAEMDMRCYTLLG